MPAPLTLTAEDWSEIYYALDTKAHAIDEGRYTPEGRPGENAEWASHLRSIMERIGPDGTTALEAGVAGPDAPAPAAAPSEHSLAEMLNMSADQAGWDTDSQLTVLLRYLASTPAAAHLNDFLADAVEGERGASEE